LHFEAGRLDQRFQVLRRAWVVIKGKLTGHRFDTGRFRFKRDTAREKRAAFNVEKRFYHMEKTEGR